MNNLYFQRFCRHFAIQRYKFYIIRIDFFSESVDRRDSMAT